MKFLKYTKQGNFIAYTGDKTMYVAQTKNNISLMPVNDEHYDELLNKRCGCCGNFHKCFVPATEQDIERWNRVE